MGKALSNDTKNKSVLDGYYDGRMGHELRSSSLEYRREYERGQQVRREEAKRFNEQKGRSDEYITTTGRF